MMDYYKRHSSRGLFRIGDFGEVTIRELLLGIAMLAIYVIGGFFIHGKIVTAIDNYNMKYANAYFIQDDTTFKQAFETEQGSYVFVYGELKAIGNVTPKDWKNVYNKSNALLDKACSQATGQYSSLSIRKEHYTMHTRTVTYTVNGKTKTRIEHYYTWDTIWNYHRNVGEITFCGEKFLYGVIDFNDPKTVGFAGNGSDRYTIVAYPTKSVGIAFLKIEDRNIGRGNTLYKKNNTVEECEALRESLYAGNGWLIAFWVMFILIGIIGVGLFCYLDNDWLNEA